MAPDRATTHPNESSFPPGVGGPVLRALANAGIRSMRDLAGWTEADLSALHGVGPKGVRLLAGNLCAAPRTDVMPSPIDAYLAALPDDQRSALARLRALLLDAVPDAEEAIKTRVPAVCRRGKIVAGYGAAKGHVALYVMVGDALTTLRDDLARFDATRRVVRFAPERPLPATLVRKIVRFRLAEIDAPTARAS